ncbi:MAG: class I SAM-dependent methyltransferase [Chitinispirillaceae bacterium]|nr:class I SAM-dependent methyltransferase [Chitinispirillaceae bacterium]
MRCSICDSPARHAFTAKILSKYDVSYFSCPKCGFLQTEKPYWLDEAYRRTLNSEDTSVLQRNWYYADVVSSVIFSLFDRHGTFLDFGGGHGVLTRLLRDKGFDFYWMDPGGENLFARGFEYNPSKTPFELVTCIECFEHFVDPRKEIETILGISPNIFFATQLLPSPVPKPEEWSYYGLTHGQHISFYSLKTLRHLAKAFGLRMYSNGTYMHLFTKERFGRLKFLRAAHPRMLQRLKIRLFMKSRRQADFEHIVRTKKALRE